MRGKPLLIRGARQLLTIRGTAGLRRGAAMKDPGIIPGGALLIRDGRIAAVGPARRIENLKEARQADEIDASGRVVAPGFVDAAACPLGVPCVAAARLIEATAAKRLRLQLLPRVEAAVRHGTTTMRAEAGFGLADASERKVLRLLAGIPLSPLRLVVGFLACRTRQASFPARRAGASSLTAYVSDYGLTIPEAAQLLQSVSSQGIPLHVLAESQVDPSDAAVLALAHGAISARGLSALPAALVSVIAASSLAIVVTPWCELEVRPLVDAGGGVALATACQPVGRRTWSLPATIAMVCAQSGFTPAEALVASTINAAHVCGLAHEAGSLEVGKNADVILLNLSDYRDLAALHGVNPVWLTIKQGEIVYLEGKVTWPGNW